MAEAADLEGHELLKGMSMLDKVAHFCILMGETDTVKIFQHLPTDMVEEVSTAITLVKSIDRETSLAILEEFHLYSKSQGFISAGGYDYAKDLLYKSLGKTEADEVLARLAKIQLASMSFSYLDNIAPKQLADFIKDESPQTIAVVLSHMDPAQAGEVLAQLEEDIKVKVTMQIATIKDVSPNVVRTISVVLEKKLESLFSSIVDVGGVKVAADMLNKLGPKAQEILKNINGIDTALATKIKENMFVFEDLVGLEQEYIMKIMQNVEVTDVAIALKNADQESMDKITSAMSQRARDRFREEFEMLTKVKIKDIEAAQRKMLDAAQKLIDEGVIERETE
jgi:flagellar motor switch protein FliG